MTTTPDVDFAHRLADAARAAVLPYFGTPLAHHRKADDTPVTRADREAEQVMRALIAEHRPGDGILGEEFGAAGADRPRLWVLDPIDGTKAFITGKPLFGTLIALLHDTRPVLGVADLPALSQRWTGAAGAPSVRDGTPCRVSTVQSLGDARLGATSIDMFEGDDRAAFERLSGQVWFRTFGGDLFNYVALAGGHLDLVVESSLAPYDVLAAVPIVEGAGGVITDWHGQPLTLASDGRVVGAATPALHTAALACLH